MGRKSGKYGSCEELVEYLAGRREGKRLFVRGLQRINCRKRSNTMFNPDVV